MALRFIIGRAGTGKTTRCLEEIREQLLREPDGPPLIMLVPEQATFQTEYELLRDARLRGTMRAQALSFRRLAFRVMQETGGAALVPIGENGKNMLLYKIVHRLSDRLQLFRGGEGQQGFIERLGELMTEWKRYGVDAEQVRDFAGTGLPGGNALLGRKLHDLQLIAGELQAELNGLYVDAEDYLSWLSAGFGQASAMKGARIWIDGFHGFTPKEYEALKPLLRHAGEVTAALCLDRPYAEDEQPHELDLFHPTAETFIKLRGLAQQEGVDVQETVVLDCSLPQRFAGSAALARLERRLYGRRAGSADDASLAKDAAAAVSLHAAMNRRAEVEAVARDIVRRVRDEGLRYRDLALSVRSAPAYADYLTAVFDDYGIPYFFDQKEAPLHHPLVEFIRSALEIAVYGWRYEAVFRCIKTELLLPDDGSVTRESLDLLENYALAAGIDGSRWLSPGRWRPLTRDSLEGEPAAAGTRELERFEAVMKAREVIVPPLRKFIRELKRAGDVRGMCEAVYKLLMSIDAPDKLERWSRQEAERGETQRSREHRQLWDGVTDILDQLTEMAGGEQLATSLFAGMMETGLESLKLAAVPPSLDQVLIGSMDRTRAGRVRVCYVLGANDGVMPQRIQEDGLLTEQERETLGAGGLAMAPGVRRRLLDERFLIYNTLATPSDHLWVSWALADEEGKSLHPSEVIRQLRQIVPELGEAALALEPSEDMSEREQAMFAEHPARTMSYLIARLRAWRGGAPMPELWWEAYSWFAARPQWQPRLSALVGALDYTNAEPSLTPSTAERLYGRLLRGSVSRMERFVSCPFQHFAIHGLRLRERELYRLAAPDIGQLFHAALSRLAESLGDRWGSMPQEQIREEAAAVVRELELRLQSQILFSSSRHQYVARKLRDIIGQAAIVLGEHARRADFKPVGLELGFGPDGPLPPVRIPLGGGRSLEMAGRIDRVDAALTEDGALLRVIDYKSGAKELRLEEVAFGLALQMLTYLDVLLTNAPQWLGQPAKPAGVLYFHVHNPLITAANALAPDKARAEVMKRFKLKGLVLADEETARKMDSELTSGVSELIPVRIKKDGGFAGTSSVVTDEQWSTLRGSVRRTLRTIGERIACGDVSIAPYRLGAKTPCQYCAYKPVCQFDPLVEGNGYSKLYKPDKQEVWDLLAASDALEEEEGFGRTDEDGEQGGAAG